MVSKKKIIIGIGVGALLAVLLFFSKKKAKASIIGRNLGNPSVDYEGMNITCDRFAGITFIQAPPFEGYKVENGKKRKYLNAQAFAIYNGSGSFKDGVLSTPQMITLTCAEVDSIPDGQPITLTEFNNA